MYNSERFIEECIKSILNQDVDLKIIVVDDASTDTSVKLVSKFPQVTLIKNRRNMGTYYSINIGLKSASTDTTWTHYTIHGSDDISMPGRFKKQLAGFKDRSKLAIGCLFARTDYRTGRIYATNPNTNESVLIFDRKIFEKIGYYDKERMACDTEYKIRMQLAFPNSIGQINESLIKSYLHDNNLTKKIPIGGSERQHYVSEFKSNHSKMKIKNNYYKNFIL